MIWALCRNLVSCELVWYPSNVQNIRKSKAQLLFCQLCPFRLPQPQPPPQKLSELQQLHSMEFQVGEGSGLGGQMGVLGEERADGREISSDSNPLPRTTKGLFNRKMLFLLSQFDKSLKRCLLNIDPRLWGRGRVVTAWVLHQFPPETLHALWRPSTDPPSTGGDGDMTELTRTFQDSKNALALFSFHLARGKWTEISV